MAYTRLRHGALYKWWFVDITLETVPMSCAVHNFLTATTVVVVLVAVKYFDEGQQN